MLRPDITLGDRADATPRGVVDGEESGSNGALALLVPLLTLPLPPLAPAPALMLVARRADVDGGDATDAAAAGVVVVVVEVVEADTDPPRMFALMVFAHNVAC